MFGRKATRFALLYGRKPHSLLCAACYITEWHCSTELIESKSSHRRDLTQAGLQCTWLFLAAASSGTRLTEVALWFSRVILCLLVMIS